MQTVAEEPNEKCDLCINSIPVRITNRVTCPRTEIPVLIRPRVKQSSFREERPRTRVLTLVKLNKPGASAPKSIPRFMTLNARSLAKPDACPALYAELMTNNIDVCSVSETWLNKLVPNHLICPSGFSILRKDRLIALGVV